MEKSLFCPMAEGCYVYKVYIACTKDADFGIIMDSAIEGGDYYNCRAFSAVTKLLEEGKLPEKISNRLGGISDCFMIHEANKLVQRRRSDY